MSNNCVSSKVSALGIVFSHLQGGNPSLPWMYVQGDIFLIRISYEDRCSHINSSWFIREKTSGNWENRVYLHAWMHIAEVPQAIFYSYQIHNAQGCQTKPHGKSDILRPWNDTVQATATLRCILENFEDHIQHSLQTLKSRERERERCSRCCWLHFNGRIPIHK